MQYPKISVVTVCRNVLNALQYTLQATWQQQYPNVEVIVVDGASTDGTVPWLQSQQHRPMRWVSEPDRGIYDAMNKGTRMATGQYVIFMNAGDCFASPTVLQSLFGSGQPEGSAQPSTQTPGASGASSSVPDVIYGAVAKRDRAGRLQVHPAQPARNSHRMFFCHQCAFTRRELLLAHPFDIGHPMSADFKFFKQLLHEGCSFRRSDVAVALFDTNGVSNRRRADGLWDNVAVVREVDGFCDRLRLLPRLYFQILMCHLRPSRR